MIPITREVRPALIIVGIGLAILHYEFDFQTLWPYWAVFFILLFLFRDFHRNVPAIPLAVVSPIDGAIQHLGEIHDPYLDRPARVVVIRQKPLGEINVHSPIEGKVQNIWVKSPDDPKSTCLALWLQTDEEDDVVTAVDLNSILRHASCRISAGQKVGQGQRCGFMAFLCEVTLYLPISANISVNLGQSVRAGSDKLAEFTHQGVE